MNKNYVAVKELDLTNATVIGFSGCKVEVQGSDIVCLDFFGNAVVKFPFEVNSQYRHVRGLPEDVGFDDEGHLVPFEIDYDDEDYFGPEEQPIEILENFSYLSTQTCTIVIKHGDYA